MASVKKIALVQRFEIRKSRKEENYGNLTLNTGREGNFASIAGKVWRIDQLLGSGLQPPPEGRIIEATVRIDEFNGAPQWSLENWRVLAGDEEAQAKAMFVQPERIDREFYRRRLEEFIEATDASRISGMALRQVFDSADFREKFYLSPAARSRHQNYPGGLLEHTLNVTSLALALADAYATPQREGLTFNRELIPVDRSLLIAAGLLHDIGKIETYKLSPAAEVTETNSFEGHLPISYAVVRELIQPHKLNPPYPGAGDEVDKLLNCILSHHGTLEYGSPVMPACVEAVILSMADVSDARLAEIATEGHQARRLNPTTRFIRSKDFSGGVFVGDWPAEPVADAPGEAKAASAPTQRPVFKNSPVITGAKDLNS